MYHHYNLYRFEELKLVADFSYYKINIKFIFGLNWMY